MRVLVVADDALTAPSGIGRLRQLGYTVEHVRTGGEVLRNRGWPDLILLDLELPDLDGLEVCGRIRATCETPVILFTRDELESILGLESGADDCLVKPYGFLELAARIEAVMRRARPGGRLRLATVSHGPLRIDRTSREVRVDGRSVDLTRKEFDAPRPFVSDRIIAAFSKELTCGILDRPPVAEEAIA